VDILSSYADAVRRNHERVAAIDTGQLGDPTPCTVLTLVDIEKLPVGRTVAL
jgi:hypothetical protein